jgi:PKD repeat protein
VFIRSGTTWTQQAKLIASDGEGYEEFGYSVSLHEDTALIGAFGDDSAKGSAYVFTSEGANQPPVADFTWTPQNPIQSQVITFDASNSYDPDGTITVYEWDWNNDGISEENHTIPIATHVWHEADTYQVTLKVTDDQGANNTITKTVNVSGMNLEIDIKGGFGVKVVITNNGTSDANDIPWQVHVEGGILGRINITLNGTIGNLPSGGTISVGKLMLFGFGPITITVKVADEEKTTSGFLFLFFVIGVK